jgi:hypothetical protein
VAPSGFNDLFKYASLLFFHLHDGAPSDRVEVAFNDEENGPFQAAVVLSRDGSLQASDSHPDRAPTKELALARLCERLKARFIAAGREVPPEALIKHRRPPPL